MGCGLQHANYSPPDRRGHLPPSQGFAVDLSAAYAFISANELIVASETSYWQLVAISPSSNAAPSHVFQWITKMHEFPVDNRLQTVGIDDAVGTSKVAVHDNRVTGGGPVCFEPPKAKFENGVHLTGLVEALATVLKGVQERN
jgi:hypothetical protein